MGRGDKGGDTPEERLAAAREKLLCFFWEPYAWQERALKEIRLRNTTAIVSSNKIGKTAVVVNVLNSWCLGYEPWGSVEGWGGEIVEMGGVQYRASSLGIKPPVNIILCGEDWKMHIGQTLVKEMKKWLPEGWYTTKRNEQGVEYLWEYYNKSMVTIMSYAQDVGLFESFRAQGAILDEPPPKDKYQAMSRGLLLDRGKTILSLTPLKEAWILDEIVLSGRKDIGVVQDLKITDNPDLYNGDLRILKSFGFDKAKRAEYFDLLLYDDAEKQTPVSDKGRRAMRFLEENVPLALHERLGELKIHKFIADIDPSDVPPRVFGQFKSLVGRVLKEFDDKVHVIKPFDVPTDWPVVPMIDFHLSKPQAVSYWTVNKQDLNYCIREVWKNMSADDIADDIVRAMKGFGWKIEHAFIDPLSKGDTAYLKNMLGSNIRDSFSIIEEKLSEHGVTLHVASKDKDSGIKNIQTWLKGPNGLPTCYVFDTCERHVYEVHRWVFDDEGKPSKEADDHFMENWYRFTLTGTKYEDYVVQPLRPRDYRGEGSWMGA